MGGDEELELESVEAGEESQLSSHHSVVCKDSREMERLDAPPRIGGK